MSDRLPGVRAVVDHQPIAVAQALAARDLRRREQHPAEQQSVLRLRRPDPRDGLARYDQDVRRRLRLDVAKTDAVLVLVYQGGWDLPVDDAFEERLLRHDFPLELSRRAHPRPERGPRASC